MHVRISTVSSTSAESVAERIVRKARRFALGCEGREFSGVWTDETSQREDNRGAALVDYLDESKRARDCGSDGQRQVEQCGGRERRASEKRQN